MDIKRLSEIEERCEMLPVGGKWEAQIPAMTGEWPSAKIKGLKIVGRLYGFAMVPTDVAEFIAHARTDVPDLVAYCKSLRAEAAELARALKALKNKTEAIAKAVYPYVSLASFRAGKDLYDGVPKMQPEVDIAGELLSRPSIAELIGGK